MKLITLTKKSLRTCEFDAIIMFIDRNAQLDFFGFLLVGFGSFFLFGKLVLIFTVFNDTAYRGRGIAGNFN